MEASEKTFRYSYTFRNLGVFYLMFLVSCVVAGLVVGIRELMYWLILFGVGVILLTLFLTFSVKISELEIATTSLLGKRSLQWSEISRVSSRGASLRLHNQAGNTLSINPNLDGSVEIFQQIYAKRPDLFVPSKNNPFLRSFKSSLMTLAAGLVLIILAVLLYTSKQYLFTAGFLGILFCAQSTASWYFSSHKITMEHDCLVVDYLRKSVSYPAGDIESIQIGRTKREQFASVLVIFRNKGVMELSGFKQAPSVMYPALEEWHRNQVARQPSLSA